MNADRRHTIQVTVALLQECSQIGLIADDSHETVSEALRHLQQQEFWQLRNQERHEGRNASTDQQVRICRVALAALDKALSAWNKDDFVTVIEQLQLAASTDGSTPKVKPKTRRKARA